MVLVTEEKGVGQITLGTGKKVNTKRNALVGLIAMSSGRDMLGKSLTYESPKGFEILHSENSKELNLNLRFQLSRA